MNVEEIIKEVFPEWPKGKRNLVHVYKINNQLTIASLTYGKTIYNGGANRDLEDEPNDEIGARNALYDLRKVIKHMRRRKEKDGWIPKPGNCYFTITDIRLHPSDPEEYQTMFDVWTGSTCDYTRLGMGLVFKTERAAHKYIRTAEIKGRKHKKQLTKMP